MTIRIESLSEPVTLPAVSQKIGDTVPTGQRWTITTLVLCNRDSSTRTVTVWRVDSGTPNQKHKILAEYSLAAGETKAAPVSQLVLESGWSIFARANVADAVTFNMTVEKDVPDV